MRLRTILLVATLLLGDSAQARAEPVWLGLRAGLSDPRGETANAVGDGFHVGASMAFPVDAHNWVGFDANYHVLGEKTSTAVVFIFPITFRQKVTILEGVLCARILLTPRVDRVAPYLKVGVAADDVRPDLTISTPVASIHTTEPHVWLGLLGGMGLSVPIGTGNRLCVEGVFHQIETREAQTNLFIVAVTYWRAAGH